MDFDFRPIIWVIYILAGTAVVSLAALAVLCGLIVAGVL